MSALLIFAALTGLCFGLYFVAALLNVFSVLSYVPETVPSLLAAFLLVLSFLGTCVGLVKTLYFSEDNRLLITYPCKGITVFSARLFVFLVSQYAKDILAFGPLLVAYMFFAKFPWFLFPWLFVALFLVTVLEVMVGGLVSVGGYYAALFVKRNSLLETLVYVILFALFAGFMGWLISRIPNRIDVSTNWGPVFNEIKAVLNGYRDDLRPLYALTLMEIGYTNGFSQAVLNLESLYALLAVLGIILLCGGLVYGLVSKLYLHLAGGSFEFVSDNSLRPKRNRKHPFWLSQILKEAYLLAKDPDLFMALFGSFTLLPIFIALLDKLFGVMDTTIVGNMYISAVNVLIISLVALNANGVISHIYSDEGKAFFLNRSYPRSTGSILLSKLLFPMLMGSASIAVAGFQYYEVTAAKTDLGGNPWVTLPMAICLIVGLISFYVGHMLFAAGLDFCSATNGFAAATLTSQNERNVTLSAFALSFLGTIFFFFFLQDPYHFFFADTILLAYIKWMGLGVLFLLFNIVLFFRKVRFIYAEGD